MTSLDSPGDARKPVEAELPSSRDDGKFIRGKDGWLFLAGDSNDVLDQHCGKRRFSVDQLERWQLLLEERVTWLAERDTPYFFVVAPDAHSVYPEKLPDDFPAAATRPIHQLIEHLSLTSSVRIVYPLDQLREQRDRPVYSMTSTHWTQLGALIALGALGDEMDAVLPVRRVTEEDVTLWQDIRPGDLGLKVRPREQSLHVWTEIRDRRSRLVHDNRVSNHGRRIEYASNVGEGACLVFGDSFANRLLPLLAEGFRRLVFAHMETLDRSLVEEVQPNAVVTVMSERFLIRPPDDRGGPSLLDLESQKRALGSMMRPPRRPLEQV